MTAPLEGLLRSALPSSALQTFTYAVPRTSNAAASRFTCCCAFRNARKSGSARPRRTKHKIQKRIKRIIEVPDAAPAAHAEMITTLRGMAEYYIVPIGIALRSSRCGSDDGDANPTAATQDQGLSGSGRPPTLTSRERAFSRAPQQRALFELLESLGGISTLDHLLEHLAFSPSVLKSLEKRGLISIDSEAVDRDPFATRPPDRAPHHSPTNPQRAAIAAIAAGTSGDVFLLHGITGSGKTLVYIELLREIVDVRGRTAIVLVPEIALTPQTVDRFRAVFGDRIDVLHSALSDVSDMTRARAQAWGKRIAVGGAFGDFAPMSDLGAIIVDEEHEAVTSRARTRVIMQGNWQSFAHGSRARSSFWAARRLRSNPGPTLPPGSIRCSLCQIV